MDNESIEDYAATSAKGRGVGFRPATVDRADTKPRVPGALASRRRRLMAITAGTAVVLGVIALVAWSESPW